MTPIHLPCVSLGDELTGPERDAAGLDHSRRWSPCHEPTLPLGRFVCPCKGCGPTCPSYLPDLNLETLE